MKYQIGDLVKTCNPNFLYRVTKVKGGGWLEIKAAYLMNGTKRQHYVADDVHSIPAKECELVESKS